MEKEFPDLLVARSASSSIQTNPAPPSKVENIDEERRPAKKLKKKMKWAHAPLDLLGWAEAEKERNEEDWSCQLCNLSEVKIGSSKGRWIEAVVDSGAVASVAKRGTFRGRIRPNAMSRAGLGYKSASRHRIPNEGDQTVRFMTQEGHSCNLQIQVASVERPLISTADLTRAGNVVSLEEKEGYITNKATGKTILLPRRGNVYILRMWVADEEQKAATGGTEAPGFTRQGS